MQRTYNCCFCCCCSGGVAVFASLRRVLSWKMSRTSTCLPDAVSLFPCCPKEYCIVTQWNEKLKSSVTISIALQCSLINTANRHFSECLINKAAVRMWGPQRYRWSLESFLHVSKRNLFCLLVAIEFVLLCCGAGGSCESNKWTESWLSSR